MNTQHTQSPRPDVIVVGGGIGGLSAAYALTRKGLHVRCSSAPRSSARSGRACRSRRTAPGSSTTTGCSTRRSGSGCCRSGWS